MQYQNRKTDELIPHARNSRVHSEQQIMQVAASIKEFGFINPVIIDHENRIIAGHGRVLAAHKLHLKEVPCLEVAHLNEAQKRAYMIADNQLALNASWNEEMLKIEIESLQNEDFNLALLGFDEDELNQWLKALPDAVQDVTQEKSPLALSERFLIPPFTVLNARQSWWQERKKKWLNLGLKSEEGRGEMLTYSKSKQPPQFYQLKSEYEKKIGKKCSWDEFLSAHPDLKTLNGSSIFDPVLCEIAYRWFCPTDGIVIDPFAGGSVRGVVASLLGRTYIGLDIRPEQIEANRQQALSLCHDPMPVWHHGDSRHIHQVLHDVAADFLFTCPPYADLEVYSDLPQNLSTLDYPEFRSAYFDIIKKSCALLKNHRFACVVVGEVRDRKKGHYHHFVGDTVQAFLEAGLSYYNEAILVTPVGSAATTAARPFQNSRKLAKTHQNVLIFVKGDAQTATSACGEIEWDENSFLDADV